MEAREEGAGLNASFLLDGEDRILEGNRDAEAFFEKPLDEVRKVPLGKANPALYGALKELLGKTRRGRGVEDYAMAYKVGKRLLRLNIDMSPYPLEALGETGILVSIKSAGLRPAPARRPPEEPAPLEEAEAHEPEDLRGFLDFLIEPAFLLDLEANFSFVNAAMCESLGQEREELTGRPLSFFLRNEGAKRSLNRLVEAAHKAPWRGELEFARRDGGVVCIAVTVSEIKSKRGGKKALLCLGRDVTTESRLRREREEELRRVWGMLERVGVAVVCFTPDLRVTMLSHSAEELLGTSSDRAVGASLPEILPAAMAEGLVPLLERAARGEEWRDERIKAGKGSLLFVSLRPAYEANGVNREYMAVFREPGREVSEAEEAEALRAAMLRTTAVLKLAAASRDEEEFLRGCLEMLQEEFCCDAAAAFCVERGQAKLSACLGLEDEEASLLRTLRLRPGHARLCGMMEMLKVEIHGGVPRRGWDEVHSLIEGADALLPLLRERRWKSLVNIPVRGEGEAAGLVAMADCEAVKLDISDARVFAALGEAVAAALSALRRRPPVKDGRGEAAGGDGEEEKGERREADLQPRRIMPVITRKATETGSPAGETAGADPGRMPSAAYEEETSEVQVSTRTMHPEHEHDYFEIAREVKGQDDADDLALFAEHEEERAIPSSRGFDLAHLLWELKEYYGKRIPRGEIFLELEEDLPRLHSDRRLLRETLDHLLDNAVRHSPPGAPVILGAERWGDEVLLRVEDQGPGIPDEVVEKIMGGESNGKTMGNGRAGITGLFLCRRYVSALGGTLSIKGKPEEGTTVLVRLRVLPMVGD